MNPLTTASASATTTLDPISDLMAGKIGTDEYFRRVREETDKEVRREFEDAPAPARTNDDAPSEEQ